MRKKGGAAGTATATRVSVGIVVVAKTVAGPAATPVTANDVQSAGHEYVLVTVKAVAEGVEQTK